MTTVFLVRHGLTAMTGPVLAGWTEGIHLDERGTEQVKALAVRLAPLELDAVVTSPLERCVETAEALLKARLGGSPLIDERFGECRYGDWTGRPIDELLKEPLWRVVQAQPSAARFPGGESLAEVSARSVAAVREWNTRLGDQASYVVCTHGDVIKAIVADALGLHLDQFQRIVVHPASVTVIRYTELRPFVLRINDTGGDFAGLGTKTIPDGDGHVGGGAGTA